MPYRLNEFRAKIQFMCSSRMPSLIHRACEQTGTPSNTVYIQRAVCEALSRDLQIPVGSLLDEQPTPMGKARVLFGGDRQPIRRSNEVEKVE